MASFSSIAAGPDFYGRADLAFTNSDNGYATQTAGKDGTVLENNFSWLGVKGNEKINDNIEIIYQMEFGVENFDNSGDTFNARNTYLGIKTAAGTALVGRNDTVFKASEGGIDMFGNTNSDIDRLMPGQDRKADGISYYSPKIADLLSLNATYLIDDNYDSESSSMYAVSATIGDKGLKAQNFYAAVSYQDGISDVEAYRGVVQAKFGSFIIGGLYQSSESQKASLKHLDGDSYYVSAAYLMGDLKLKAAYGYDDSGLGKFVSNYIGQNDTVDSRENISDVEIQQLSIGADYRLSKNALVYGHYTKYDGDMTVNSAAQKTDLKDDVITIGLRYDF